MPTTRKLPKYKFVPKPEQVSPYKDAKEFAKREVPKAFPAKIVTPAMLRLAQMRDEARAAAKAKAEPSTEVQVIEQKPANFDYKFMPAVKKIAQSEEAARHLFLEKLVTKDVLKGRSYEDIAADRDITPQQAREYSKAAIARWAGELGHTATEAKEIDVKRMDALLEKLHGLIFPEEFVDYATGRTIMPPPDMEAVRLYVMILSQRSKLLGTEAATKLEEKKVELLERVYKGVAVTEDGLIDL